MVVSLQNIISDARKVIDEIAANESDMVLGSDDSELDAILSLKAVEAVDFVHRHADVSLMALDTAKVAAAASGVCDVSDMLRFLIANDTSWAHPVVGLIEEGSPAHSVALDAYIGASAERPCAVLGVAADGSASKRVVTLLPSGASGFVRFVPRAVVTGGSALVDSNLYSQVINYLAGIALLSLGDSRANDLIELAYSQLGISQKS